MIDYDGEGGRDCKDLVTGEHFHTCQECDLFFVCVDAIDGAIPGTPCNIPLVFDSCNEHLGTER